MSQSAEKDAAAGYLLEPRPIPPGDERDPRPCPRCGEVCKYDGWGHVHANGVGIDSCPIPPATPAPPEPPRVEGSGA